MVEFALIFPILMMLLVALADFGRIFAAGVIVEAAARDAAEIVAQNYIANPPGSASGVLLSDPPPNPPDPAAYYSDLHAKGVRAACVETKNLPNSNFDPALETCTGGPHIYVCVHDGVDDACDVEAQGATPPSSCDEMAPPPNNGRALGEAPRRWVEVRLCYKFTTILKIPVTGFTEFYVQRTRSFTIACWLKSGAECG